MIKTLAQKVVRKCVSNDRIWNLLDATVLRAARFADEVHRQNAKWIRDSEIEKIFYNITHGESEELVVMHGVFAGMKYPKLKSFGSEVYPKIIGSYETELSPIFEHLLKKDFNKIINIGCAEGYYAVGMAMRMPMVTVYAYDINDEARDQCRRMAEINGVSGRVVIGGEFCINTLKSMDLRGSGLIICDCEGCEKEIFTEDAISILKCYELIVETHDFIDINISRILKERFKETHSISSVKSIDDIEKAQKYNYEELKNIDLDIKRTLLAEQRPSIMEWLHLEPISRA